MISFNRWVNYRPCTDCVIISCKLGHWSVKGDYSLETAQKAEAEYLRHKAAGKYKKLPKEKNNGSAIKIK